jgi:hypothetical protein
MQDEIALGTFEGCFLLVHGGMGLEGWIWA